MAELQGDPNAAIKELRKQVTSNRISLVKNSLILDPEKLDFWSTISTFFSNTMNDSSSKIGHDVRK